MEQTVISNRDEALQALIEKTKDVRIATLTTVGADGELHTRPMGTREIGDDGVLWFFTGADSQKAHDLESNQHASLCYADPGKNLWVSVTGTAELVRDERMVHELWMEPLEAFFPNGPDDPNLVLVRVTPETGEIWDGPSSLVGRAIAFARTYASGGKTPPGDDVRLDLQQP